MTNEIEARSQANLLKAVARKYILDELYSIAKGEEETIKNHFGAGDNIKVLNSQGVEMGSCVMTNPKKKAVCTDMAILLGMAEEKGYEIEDTLPRDEERIFKAIEVLQKHAPELLDFTISNDDLNELSDEILEDWQVTGETPLGWEVKDASKPVFSVKIPSAKTKKGQLARKSLAHLIDPARAILALEQGI